MQTWQKFRYWLAQALPGEEFAYHNGLLAWDREKDQEVEKVAQDAMLAQEQGLVWLVQLRLPYSAPMSRRPMTGGCLYVARRTGKPI